MTTSELQELIADFKEYADTVVRVETPEEARQILIRTGVIDESGDIILRHPVPNTPRQVVPPIDHPGFEPGAIRL